MVQEFICFIKNKTTNNKYNYKLNFLHFQRFIQARVCTKIQCFYNEKKSLEWWDLSVKCIFPQVKTLAFNPDNFAPHHGQLKKYSTATFILSWLVKQKQNNLLQKINDCHGGKSNQTFFFEKRKWFSRKFIHSVDEMVVGSWCFI